MRKGILGLVTSLLASGGIALAQPAPPPIAPRGDPPPAIEKIPSPKSGDPADPLRSRLNPETWLDSDVPAEADAFDAYDACPPRGWVDLEYLLWWVKEGPITQPLVTTGSVGSGGILLRPNTTVLFGGEGVDFSPASGMRINGGRWLGDNHTLGVEASGFFLGERSDGFNLSSDPVGVPLLARPLQNAATNDETSILLSAPNRFSGGIAIKADSRLWGAETNLLANLLREGQTGIDLLVGFRYLDLDEGLSIASQTMVQGGGVGAFLGAPVLAPNAVAITDIFATRNQFFGGQIGARGTVRSGRLLVDVTGKLAIGANRRLVRVSGFTELISPEGLEDRATGGALALPTNIGRRRNVDTSFVPEGTVRVGYQLTSRLRGHIGANLLYFDNVVRPGDQVDRRVNFTQVPSSFAFNPLTGPRLPAPLFLDSRYWALGLDFGLAFQF